MKIIHTRAKSLCRVMMPECAFLHTMPSSILPLSRMFILRTMNYEGFLTIHKSTEVLEILMKGLPFLAYVGVRKY
jgi:hypothetical protein